jgi:paraquat-inducible protein A
VSNNPPKDDVQFVECSDCGLTQKLQPQRKGQNRVCVRCHSSFGDGGAGSHDYLFSLLITLLVVLLACNFYPLLGIDIKGHVSSTTLATARDGLAENGMAILSYFVFGLLVLVPLFRLMLQICLFYCLWRNERPPWLGRCFRLIGTLQPWAMLDIFLVGIFVALSKLRSVALISYLPGVYLLGIFVTLIGITYSHYDPRRTWNQILPPPPVPTGIDPIACTHCELLQAPHPNCLRCDAPLHRRKPNSISRTWALVIASLLLYIPANIYPMLTIVNFGREKHSTILDGIRDLWTKSDWPFAVIIFAASILVPLFKLTGLLTFLLALRFRHTNFIKPFTRLYRVFDFIGRWSMLDVFVASMLCTLVAFDNLTSILPGPAIMPFAAVVVLTMCAVSSFDPRLLWDMVQDDHG